MDLASFLEKVQISNAVTCIKKRKSDPLLGPKRNIKVGKPAGPLMLEPSKVLASPFSLDPFLVVTHLTPGCPYQMSLNLMVSVDQDNTHIFSTLALTFTINALISFTVEQSLSSNHHLYRISNRKQ